MGGFFQQFKALLWRNVLLKNRNRGQLFQELFYPVYFVAILAMIRIFTKPDTKPSLTFPPHDVNSPQFGQPFNGDTMIYGVPNASQYEQLMKDVVSNLNGPPQYRMFDTIENAEVAYKINYKKVKFGIIFNYGGDPNAYAIRTSFKNIPSSSDTYDYQGGSCREDKNATSSNNCGVNNYMTSGFIKLQMAVDNALMTILGVSSSAISSRQASVQMMDLGEFDPDTSYIQTISSIYFVFSFCCVGGYLAVHIVTEKEKKIKDGMMMMGLNTNTFWLSWATIYLGMVIFSAVLMIIVIVATSFFKESNMFLLFIMLNLYGISLIALAFLLSTFFSKAKVAGAVAGFTPLIVSLLYLIVTETRDQGSYDSNVPVWVQYVMCLLSPLAFATSMDQAIFLDVRAGGFGFDESLTKGKFPLYIPIVMMLVDTLLYSILTFYFDKVVPTEYGVRYKPLFFLDKSYWFPSRANGERERLVQNNRHNNSAVDIEPVPADLESRLSMKISSISKSFKIDNKETFAVNDFSLDIYEGHITCLLGHNGAGKTTLMNILTGVIPPTSGYATIRGLDITIPGQMVQIRKQCGICPQHDILFDLLSCKEHLRMFADIKGVPVEERERTVLQALKDVDLETQADTFSKDLSGGQKRKLSVAIALIGDPKVIFLDEPTAGMDPYSRRHLWSLLKKMKEGRVVLLTTHFMDEADILSDRKAFIRKGKLRCCGSSLFLKNKFGIGYHLTMVVEPNCDIGNMTSALSSIIPDIKHERTHGKEVAYTVPLSDVSKFSQLFGKLDVSSSSLGIKSYGVSMTTLEEVFLKLEGVDQSEAPDDEALNGHYGKNDENVNDGLADSTMESALFTKDLVTDEKELKKQQFMILLWIRFLSVIRNKKAIGFQVILPVVLVVAGMIQIKLSNKNVESDPTSRVLSLDSYVNSTLSPYLPNLLAFDSLNTADSRNQISEWKDTYGVDSHAPSNTSFLRPHYAGVQLNGMDGKLLTDFVAVYNKSALHSIPALMSLVTQSLINASNINALVNVSSYPWPKMERTLQYDSATMTAGLLIGLAFVITIPGFSSEIVRDRESRLRSQLRISGIDFNVYWGTNYVIDFAIYIIPTLLIIIIALAVQIPGLDSGGAIAALLILFLTNIPFLCFFSFICSFMFEKAESCTTYLPFVLNLAAILPYSAISTVDMVTETDVAIILHYVFCVIDPPYIIMGGFYFISRVNLIATMTGKNVDEASYFDPDYHTFIAMIMPIVHLIWMYWLLRVLDVLKTGGKVKEAFPCFSKSANVTSSPNTDRVHDEDTDVQIERAQIDNLTTQAPERYSLSVDMQQINPKVPVAYTKNLRKTFVKRVEKKSCFKPGKDKTKVAVRNLSLGVNQGDVLGLLGPNGAGKTTALNMIISETEPTCGQVMVGGENIRSRMLNMASLGYCPQHDALWDVITLREHIICFAVIKGVPKQEAERLVDFYVSNMKLEDHKLKRSNKLSGGTKRKLSYIISILGNPDLVLLDEPSTGMDPQSKRFLWDTISATFRNTNKGAILTTHYMEEADALCSRVGIMVNGQLQCLGSTQHLKDKFGSGYILEVKLAYILSSEVEKSMDRLENHLRELFPNMQPVERFMERAQYAIPKEDVKSLGATFASLEDCKQSHQLEEYNFSQSSLEQVFLHFAKRQLEEEEEDRKGSLSVSRQTSQYDNVAYAV